MDAKRCSLRLLPRMASLRLTRIVALVLLLLILLPLLLTHYYISKFVSEEPISANGHVSGGTGTGPLEESQRSVKMERLENLEALQKVKDLSKRIKEMMRIRGSVSNELRSLESRRQKLQTEMTTFSQKLEELKTVLNRKQLELERVHVSLEQAQYAQREALLKNQPFIARPLQLLPEPVDPMQSKHSPKRGKELSSGWRSCLMHSCFDYSRCSLTSGFPVYFYHPLDEDDNDDDDNSEVGRDNEMAGASNDHVTHRTSLKSSILDAFNGNLHITFDPTIACTFVVILFGQQYYRHNKSSSIESYLYNLNHWDEGHNHVIINLIPDLDILEVGVDPGKALVVQKTFSLDTFRPEFDVVLASTNVSLGREPESPLHCPATRKYLVSFQGAVDRKETRLRRLVSILEQFESKSGGDLFKFDFDSIGSNPVIGREVLLESTFALIIPPANANLISSPAISERLRVILESGAVPVLLGGDYLKLPFHEVIDWRRAVIFVPVSRVTELHFLLKSFRDGDILDMKRQGNLLYKRYLSNTQAIVNTILALIRQKRLQIPAPPAAEELSVSLFNQSFPMKFYDPSESVVSPDSTEPDENLGPIEPAFPTLSYQRNFSLTLCHGHDIWNDVTLDPFALYPYTPFDPILPSEAKFSGSSFGFRPIGGGTGGAGKEFSEALGGNVPKEQFTIVMLTYEREAVLMDSLQRLKGLPHLNKILVIWNSPSKQPGPDLRWPDVGVPIQVVKSRKNSLNNRFQPYDEIETEAILSMDDDAHLRHDEIIFGFRVWREARDRIVGFPGRFHAWDTHHNAWLYNSNYSCELSMVLTGAAFFHKYYAYLYSYSMPSSIRDKVDEYMNCEDIAMNFLASHVTRKPPIKVTSRWTFRCPGCPVSLSEDDSHFHERHKCINFFATVYGYNPLLNTQFRADSVLFKTRIPHDKQKCFKFI